MDFFDCTILSYVNGFSRLSWIFDYGMAFLAGSDLFKGGVLAAMIWWAWFTCEPPPSKDRERIISTLLGSVMAVLLARGLALILPFRLRPLHDDSLHFLLPYGRKVTVLEGWSSFPSDHAVLFFTLSTGLLFISKKAGVFALVYTAVVICFPRVYLGLHYPTDIICGAVIGVSIGWLGNSSRIAGSIPKQIPRWAETKPGIFYAIFFLLTYQIAELFYSSRTIVKAVVKLFSDTPV